MDGARAKIASAEDALGSAKDAFDAMSLSEDPKDAFAEVKRLVKDTAEKVREAHRALTQVINSIRGTSELFGVLDDDSSENSTSTSGE